MACLQPVMDQESTYFGALEAASVYEVAEDELTLKDADGVKVAVYAVTDQGLTGTSWQVIAYNNGKGGVVSVILDTEITADFGADGQVTGSAGCNNYFAPYETDGEDITIGPAGTTRKACQEPEGILEQESQYLVALETAVTYKIEGLNMEMRTAEGALAANFRRAPGR
jgi:heat shock protein HslJ